MLLFTQEDVFILHLHCMCTAVSACVYEYIRYNSTMHSAGSLLGTPSYN